MILLTASGALALGPLFFQTIAQGAKTGAKSSLILSIAHTIVEFSLIMTPRDWPSCDTERNIHTDRYWNSRRHCGHNLWGVLNHRITKKK